MFDCIKIELISLHLSQPEHNEFTVRACNVMKPWLQHGQKEETQNTLITSASTSSAASIENQFAKERL